MYRLAIRIFSESEPERRAPRIDMLLAVFRQLQMKRKEGTTQTVSANRHNHFDVDVCCSARVFGFVSTQD